MMIIEVIIMAHRVRITDHEQVPVLTCTARAAPTPEQIIHAPPGVQKLQTGVSGKESEAVFQEAVQEHLDQAPVTGLLRHDHGQAADSVNNDCFF